MKYVARVAQVLHSGIHATANGVPLPLADRVEIQVEKGKHARFLLVRYTESGEFGGDTWHDDLDLALEQAAYEYGLRPEDFTMMDD